MLFNQGSDSRLGKTHKEEAVVIWLPNTYWKFEGIFCFQISITTPPSLKEVDEYCPSRARQRDLRARGYLIWIFDGYLQGAQSSVSEDSFGATEKMEKMMA